MSNQDKPVVPFDPYWHPTNQDSQGELREELWRLFKVINGHTPKKTLDAFVEFINAHTQKAVTEARIVQLKVIRKSYPKKNTAQGQAVSRLTLADIDRMITTLTNQDRSAE